LAEILLRKSGIKRFIFIFKIYLSTLKIRRGVGQMSESKRRTIIADTDGILDL